MEHDKNLVGRIFNIQRYSLHDGTGIRTLVFLKGCPLRCLWCSNPESHRSELEVGFNKNNCMMCGACLASCTAKAITLPDYGIDRSRCTDCLACAMVCQVGAKKVIGNDMTVAEVMEVVEKDRVFYKNSNGGITVGGGEPAFQSHFVNQLLKLCKNRNIGTRIETCGYASYEAMQRTVEYADLIYYDIKHMNSSRHKEISGVGNEIILENVMKIGRYKEVVVRVPLIPNINDDEGNIQLTLEFAGKIEGLVEVEFLYYHNLGISKYKLLDRPYPCEEIQIYTEKQKSLLKDIVKSYRGHISIRME